MRNPMSGRLTVFLTYRNFESVVLDICAELTSNEERLILADAAGCFDPVRMSRATPSVARNVHVLRFPQSVDFDAVIAPALRNAVQRVPARKVLLIGVLDQLYGPQMPTREAARALGRIKNEIEALTTNGFDVAVLCRAGAPDTGARTYIVSSICASADAVCRMESVPQQNIDGASAAIA